VYQRVLASRSVTLRSTCEIPVIAGAMVGSFEAGGGAIVGSGQPPVEGVAISGVGSDENGLGSTRVRCPSGGPEGRDRHGVQPWPEGQGLGSAVQHHAGDEAVRVALLEGGGPGRLVGRSRRSELDLVDRYGVRAEARMERQDVPLGRRRHGVGRAASAVSHVDDDGDAGR